MHSKWLMCSVMLGICYSLFAHTSLHATEARQWTAQSGPQTVALVELYTSEGCNSCPPADTWMRELTRHGFTPDRLVALGLHVDYWDYLGWPDRFAQPLFTERQRAIAARHGSRTIYTPQVVLQGEDFRRWNTLENKVRSINNTPARAQLQLQVSSREPRALEVRADAVLPEVSAEQRQAQLYVALYHNNVSSRVTAGENAGHTLTHDFVVRQWLGPFALDAQGKVQVQRTMHLEPDWQLPTLGIVAFVQHPRSGDIFQALALPLQ